MIYKSLIESMIWIVSSRLPNLHHLELFYHVANAGGISAAVRAMPYGIQQPAVSAQIGRLETELGVSLFQRRPFRLTPAGEELYGFLDPFFRKLPEVAEKIAGHADRRLRLTAPTSVIREYLPEVLAGVRRKFPAVEISLKDARHLEMIAELESGEVDLAVIEQEGRPPRGMRREALIELPLVLWLPANGKMPRGGLRELAETMPLLRPPADTVLARLFERGLQKHRLHWPVRMELRTADLALEYASRGFGVGVGHRIPNSRIPKGVTFIPLKGFPPLVICAMWRGKPGRLVEATLEGLRDVSNSVKHELE